MAAVSDSSPLILYARIGRLTLLHEVFGEVAAPLAVRHEVAIARHGLPGAADVVAASWIRWLPATDQASVASLRKELGHGEAEAIALAVQLASELGEPLTLLLDDRAARRRARQLGLAVTGSGGVLVRAKEQRAIPSVQPVLDALREAGLYLSALTYRAILTVAAEPPDDA
ncbi:MAG: DUF3368 domain-containing protein [Chloroflexota bacterium]|nr:DUF3368 domain-containing protein [Chloroflexota bacterium]